MVIYKSKVYLQLVVLFLIIGTNLIFAQSESLYSNPILHKIIFKGKTIDLFPKMTPTYIYQVDGEYYLTKPLLKTNNKLRKFKFALVEGSEDSETAETATGGKKKTKG